jgi:transposase
MRLSPQNIYDTYLRGPAAIIRLFEQTFSTHALCDPPMPSQQQEVIDSLGAQLDDLQAQLDRSRQECGTLRGENYRLRGRLAELEAIITKDSHNSSRPPSSDPPSRKRTKSLRRPSGRRPGGQPGHPGATLLRTTKPSRVIMHRPAQCHHCAGPLALGHFISSERRQVIDIIPARLRVTEHQAVVRCMNCGLKSKGEFPQSVRASVQYGSSVKARALYLLNYQLLPYARVREAMGELFGCWPSKRTLESSVAECAGALVKTELRIKRRLRRSMVVHADETGLRVGGRHHYVHVASTSRLTHYGYDAHRGRTAMDEINILPRYRGTLVHDGWWAYSYYTGCQHALCGAHLLRELLYFSELDEEHKGWAAPLGELLLEIKREVEQVKEAGGTRLAETRLAELMTSYERLVGEGLKANPPPEVPDPLGKQARNLLLRLDGRQAEVLRFMTDLRVPFDNNQAERDLRMIKLRQKTSGCFRREEGARQFCRIRSYVSTMRKQGRGALKSLERACAGVAFHPTS